MNPLFSVVVPTFNSVQYAGEAVASVLKQDYRNIEVVVDDNVSQDGTGAQLIDRFSSDPRFKIFENREDLNIPNGWNRGMARANGEYILLLHSDNILHPQCVGTLVSFLERFHADLAYADCEYFEGTTGSSLFETLPQAPPPFDLLSPGSRAVSYLFRYQRMIPTSALAIRRSCFKGQNPFNPKYRWDPDMELLSRLAYEFGVIHVKAKLAAIRSHEGQVINWRDPVFSTQYKELLELEHEFGQSERHHFLLNWASSNEDITKRLIRDRAPLRIFAKFAFRWLGAETQLLLHFTKNYLRKMKSLLSVLKRRRQAPSR